MCIRDSPQVPVILPIIAAIIACMLFGMFNGFFVAKYDMHPFIATLAVQFMIYGACSLYFEDVYKRQVYTIRDTWRPNVLKVNVGAVSLVSRLSP